MKHIKLFEQFVNEEYLTEGKVSPDKIAKSIYGTNANSAPEMEDWFVLKPGDSVTVISPSLNKASELLSYVLSMPTGTAWMSQKTQFGSSTLYAAFKNMSQNDFESLKMQFPNADILTLDMYNSMKAKVKPMANMKKLKDVTNVADSAAKY